METYNQYKEVNEQWCSHIPSHWDILRLKKIFQERKERNNPVKTDFLLSLTAKQGVVPHSEKEGTGGNKPKDDLTKYNIAHEGDLLVNCMNGCFWCCGCIKVERCDKPGILCFGSAKRRNKCVVLSLHIQTLPIPKKLAGTRKRHLDA